MLLEVYSCQLVVMVSRYYLTFTRTSQGSLISLIRVYSKTPHQDNSLLNPSILSKDISTNFLLQYSTLTRCKTQSIKIHSTQQGLHQCCSSMDGSHTSLFDQVQSVLSHKIPWFLTDLLKPLFQGQQPLALIRPPNFPF